MAKRAQGKVVSRLRSAVSDACSAAEETRPAPLPHQNAATSPIDVLSSSQSVAHGCTQGEALVGGHTLFQRPHHSLCVLFTLYRGVVSPLR